MCIVNKVFMLLYISKCKIKLYGVFIFVIMMNIYNMLFILNINYYYYNICNIDVNNIKIFM